MSAPRHIAAGDCERCRHGIIAQPVNTVSSLAFCLAGLVVARRAGARGEAAGAERALGWSAVAAGLGSVAYHGPGTRAGQILHDASLLTMLGTLIAADMARTTRHSPPPALLGALPVGATVLAASRWSLTAQVVLGAVAAGAEVARVRASRASASTRRRAAAEAIVASAGAIGHTLGRTDGPLCRPESPFQAHAAWHTAMATVLVLRD